MIRPIFFTPVKQQRFGTLSTGTKTLTDNKPSSFRYPIGSVHISLVSNPSKKGEAGCLDLHHIIAELTNPSRDNAYHILQQAIQKTLVNAVNEAAKTGGVKQLDQAIRILSPVSASGLKASSLTLSEFIRAQLSGIYIYENEKDPFASNRPIEFIFAPSDDVRNFESTLRKELDIDRYKHYKSEIG